MATLFVLIVKVIIQKFLTIFFIYNKILRKQNFNWIYVNNFNATHNKNNYE